MQRSNSKIFIIALMLTIFLSSAFLFACNKNNEEVPVTIEAGINGSVEKIIEGETEFYIAKPDDWHTFVGWFDGYRKYSENPKLMITKKTPKKLNARFTTTGLLSFDRILNSLYNSYKIGISSNGEYFNFLGEGNFSFNDEQTKIKLGGYLNFLGKGNQIYFNSEDDNTFSFIYNDNAENGTFYFENNGEKLAFDDMGLISNILKRLPKPSQNEWTIENILNNERLFYQFDQYFGYLNAFGLVSNVQNSENKTELTLSFNKLLTLLKNYYPMFEEGSLGKSFIDVLTGCYPDGNYPKMELAIKVNYNNVGYESINNIEIDCNLDKDYYLNFEENVVIPKGNINIKINKLKYGFGDQANKIEDDELGSYPVSEEKMINAHFDGKLAFIAEGESDKIVDNYTVEFDADINPLALLAFKGEEEGLYDIEWQKLGFLSFRIVLDPFEDKELAKEQYIRHKGSTDYINILIDTKRFGAKVFVYAAFYDPSTLFSTTYIINNSFDIPSLLSFSKDEQAIENNMSPNDENSLIGLSKLLQALLSLNFNSDNLNNSFYQILSNVLSDEFNTNIALEEDKISVNIQNIREIIRAEEKKNGLVISGNPIKMDRYLFGNDETGITKLELSFDENSFSKVKKDDKGNYLSSAGGDIVKEFNDKHSLVLEVLEIGDLTNLTLEQICNLENQSVTVTKLLLSDGSERDKYVDCDGKTSDLSLYVHRVSVSETADKKVKIRLIMFVNSPMHTIITLTNSISNILYQNLSLPYGLIEYTFYI